MGSKVFMVIVELVNLVYDGMIFLMFVVGMLLKCLWSLNKSFFEIVEKVNILKFYIWMFCDKRDIFWDEEIVFILYDLYLIKVL